MAHTSINWSNSCSDVTSVTHQYLKFGRFAANSPFIEKSKSPIQKESEMRDAEVKTVSDALELKKVMQRYASEGFANIHQDENSVTLARKKPFNWVFGYHLFIHSNNWLDRTHMDGSCGIKRHQSN